MDVKLIGFNFFAQMKAWGSPQICNRNLHISFTMGCREDFFNKTQKTGGRGGFCPCLVELGLTLIEIFNFTFGIKEVWLLGANGALYSGA